MLDGFRERSGIAPVCPIATGKFRRGLNLSPPGHTHARGDQRSDPRSQAESDQNEIDQRDQGRSDAGGDQGVVSADAGLRIERGSVGFSGHLGGLGQAGRVFCEARHIRPIFFKS